MAVLAGIGIIGFGEVGLSLAADFARAGVSPVTVYQRRNPAAPDTERPSLPIDVGLSHDLGDLSFHHLVICVVVPSAAVDAARAFAPHASEGGFYLDLNSATPAMMTEAQALLAPLGIRFVDGMIGGAGVAGRGLSGLDIGLSGPDAELLGRYLRSFGITVRVLGDKIGRASALKMVRGIFMKSLEPLLIETLLVAKRHGLMEEVLESVAATMGSKTFEQILSLLVGTHVAHGRRRLDEARLIRETVAATDVAPLMVDAAIAFLERSIRVREGASTDNALQWRDTISLLDSLLADDALESQNGAEG